VVALQSLDGQGFAGKSDRSDRRNRDFYRTRPAQAAGHDAGGHLTVLRCACIHGGTLGRRQRDTPPILICTLRSVARDREISERLIEL
jgi:hypothetical protein